MHIFDCKHHRLSPRASHDPTWLLPPTADAGILRALNQSSRSFRRSGMSRSGTRKETFSAGSILISARVFSRSASCCSAGCSCSPNRWRPHWRWDANGVFCSSCEQLNSVQLCGVSRRRVCNSSIRPRLAQPWLADNQHQLAIALLQPGPSAASATVYFFFAAAGGVKALAGAASATARSTSWNSVPGSARPWGHRCRAPHRQKSSGAGLHARRRVDTASPASARCCCAASGASPKSLPRHPLRPARFRCRCAR